MPIYCVVMSDVKQESLANAKVRICLLYTSDAADE